MINAIKDSSPGVLLIRIIVAALIVLGSYNPSGKSVYHWVVGNENPTDAWVILVAIIAILLNIGLLIAAWKALGMMGTTIILIFFAAVAYLSLQEGWISPDNVDSVQWGGLILYSVFLGIGLAGAILWRRATGQVVVDEADEGQ